MWKNLSVLVTGATGGLGEPLCEMLASAGASVIVHGRDRARVTRLASRLNARSLVSDLSSLTDRPELPAVDVLVNNAGVGFGADRTKREVSRDGLELRFAVNYVAPFVLTHALLSRGGVKAVVNVASLGQLPIVLDDLQSERAYDGVDAYRRSKLALVMLSLDLAASQPVPVVSLHPGTFLDTGMVRDAGITPQGTARHGAEMIKLVAERALGGETGVFFDENTEARANAQAYDVAVRAALATKTRELVQRIM